MVLAKDQEKDQYLRDYQQLSDSDIIQWSHSSPSVISVCHEHWEEQPHWGDGQRRLGLSEGRQLLLSMCSCKVPVRHYAFILRIVRARILCPDNMVNKESSDHRFLKTTYQAHTKRGYVPLRQFPGESCFCVFLFYQLCRV